MRPRFTEAESYAAFEAWGCNCGPSALALVTGRTLDEVRPVIPGFDAKRYTSPTMMFAALDALGVGWKRIGTDRPTFGLCRIQWGGRWMKEGVPERARYRYTHWVGWWQTPERGTGVWDVNCMNNGTGWSSLKDWDEFVAPMLASTYQGTDYSWSVTHGVEIER